MIRRRFGNGGIIVALSSSTANRDGKDSSYKFFCLIYVDLTEQRGGRSSFEEQLRQMTTADIQIKPLDSPD